MTEAHLYDDGYDRAVTVAQGLTMRGGLVNDRPDRAQLRAELDTALRHLTEPSTHPVVRDDTSIATGELPSLLDQLRESLGGHGESNGRGRGGHRTPADVTAIDIEEDIEGEAGELQARLETYVPLEARLRHLSDVGQYLDADALRYALGRVRSWAGRIRSHLDPPRRLHLAARCPACDKRSVMVRTDTGDPEQHAALQVDGERGCVCLACGEHWPPEQLEHLALVLKQQQADDDERKARERDARRAAMTEETR